eukprot:CAMPEP_0184657328 /NCGR_PEP_ID=MMETSP0308-20130426/19009_1 /TAXON_ID=38269 /ORGANISM="Gloeochaete witrockiana, Strain SAG 46.84" /LENGTH=298 /DNA_ID=CAMNT_0027095053 /DNA_START=95 /DNA_END=991 /DNA_ORIENTATION=+
MTLDKSLLFSAPCHYSLVSTRFNSACSENSCHRTGRAVLSQRSECSERIISNKAVTRFPRFQVPKIQFHKPRLPIPKLPPVSPRIKALLQRIPWLSRFQKGPGDQGGGGGSGDGRGLPDRPSDDDGGEKNGRAPKLPSNLSTLKEWKLFLTAVTFVERGRFTRLMRGMPADPWARTRWFYTLRRYSYWVCYASFMLVIFAYIWSEDARIEWEKQYRDVVRLQGEKRDLILTLSGQKFESAQQVEEFFRQRIQESTSEKSEEEWVKLGFDNIAFYDDSGKKLPWRQWRSPLPLDLEMGY